jgi:hypothetical protein
MKKHITKERLSAAFLMLGTFFLPFGYDVLFVGIMKLTGSYLTTDLIFYFISFSFFTAHFILNKERIQIRIAKYNFKSFISNIRSKFRSK